MEIEVQPDVQIKKIATRFRSNQALIRCRKCKSRMVGVSARARGTKFEYYACTKRLDTSDCDMDYIRAD
jgi:hypothetical protein